MKIRFIKISLMCFLLVSLDYAQKEIQINNLSTDYVLRENAAERKIILNKTINDLFAQEINEVDQKELAKKLYEVNISYISSDKIDKKILSLLNNWNLLDRKLKSAVFEYVSIHQENKFLLALENIVEEESNPAFLAQALILLSRNDYGKKYIEAGIAKIDSQNQLENSINIFKFFREELIDSTFNHPPIKDLLSHDFQKGKTIIYSFHRRNRIHHGLTVIKNPNGEFLRNADSSLFSIPQLAYSVSNMPWFIKNGNTPQGIYSIVGWYISPTKSIGPTPIILTRIPYEKPPSTFFHGKNIYDYWNIKDYKDILPESWKNYGGIYQSYYAGKIGRRLIVMHGSTDDLNDYKDKPFYPLTPTRGCLSAKEIWSETTGKCLESDQVKLVNAFFSTEQLKGFLVVVEIDDKEEPINISEIEKIIIDAKQTN